MINKITDVEAFKKIFDYARQIEKKYGKISNLERIMIKRTVNSAMHIVEGLKYVSFEELELTIYVKITDKEMRQFTKLFEYQIEEAKLHESSFVNNLHEFYKKTGRICLEKPRLFFDFIDCVGRAQRERKDGAKIFDLYLSLLIQQCAYFSFLRGYEEKLCCGLSTDNQLLYKNDIFPFSDYTGYDLEKEFYDSLVNKKQLDFNKVKVSYKKHGYDINAPEDIEILDNAGRIFENNHYMMLSYINEYTLNMLPNTRYVAHPLNFPRRWVDTELYLERLTKRKYCLPAGGVIAKYYNAGEINEIHFMEIYKNNKIILLYKVYAYKNNEFSGFFDTTSQDFYSIFERTNLEEFNQMMKNFILENYYLLTCEQDIDKKRLTKLLVVDDINKPSFENYTNQPVVCYLYHKKEGRSKEKKVVLHHYDRNNYVSEKTSVNGYIRKLPVGQNASDEARALAVQLGYDLSSNETFVRPFKKSVLKIKEI